jgi:hypothetical protein
MRELDTNHERLQMCYLILFARTVIGGTFLISGLAKIPSRPRSNLNLSLSQYGVLFEQWGSVLGVLLLITELLTAGIVLLTPAYRFGLLLAIGLLGVIVLILIHGLVTRKRAICYCFGYRGGTIGVRHVTTNIGLMGLALLAASLPSRLGSHAHLSLGPAILTVGIATETLAIITLADYLIEALDGVELRLLFLKS